MAKPSDALTLFGPAEDLRPAPLAPASGKVVHDLVLLGVPEETARGYGRKQAFAVLASLRGKAERLARAGDPADPGRPARPATRIRWPAPVVMESVECLDQLIAQTDPDALARVISAEVFGLELFEVRLMGECLARIYASRRTALTGADQPRGHPPESDGNRADGRASQADDARIGASPGASESEPGGGPGPVVGW